MTSPHKIELVIDADALGENTDDDNARYMGSVLDALEVEYPRTTVNVTLSGRGTPKLDVLGSDDRDQIIENIELIYQRVWDKGEFYCDDGESRNDQTGVQQ